MLQVLSLDFQVADVPCRLVTVNPNNESGPEKTGHLQHSHSGFEIHWVRSGTLSVDCIGERIQLSAGQILILPPDSYHYVRSVSAQAQRMDMLLEIGREAQKEAFLRSLFRRQPMLPEQSALPDLLEKIRQITLDYKGDFLQKEWLKTLCAQLVLEMGAAAQTCPQESAREAYEGTDLRGDRYIMDHFFNHNYGGSSDMQALAKKLNMSVRQTGRILQQTYGKGFREKMNECRLAVAVDLLKNTAKPMAEISEILGYSDPANFSSFVKRQTGKSPARIRKEK